MLHERNRLTNLSKRKQATTGTLIYGGTDSETCNSTSAKVGGYRIVPSIGHLGADAHGGYTMLATRTTRREKPKLKSLQFLDPNHAIPPGGLYSMGVWGIVRLD